MAVKIRLKRMGKIRAPYYRIVVADSRTKRDGRAIEEIGKYHPTEEPSFIEVEPRARAVLARRSARSRPSRSWRSSRSPVTGRSSRACRAPRARCASPRRRPTRRPCSRPPPRRPWATTAKDGATTPRARRRPAKKAARGSARGSRCRGSRCRGSAAEAPRRPARPRGRRRPRRRGARGRGDVGADRGRRRRRAGRGLTCCVDALEHLVRGIVGTPTTSQVRSKPLRRGTLLEVRVHPEDLGRVIGRSGRTATALRTVVKALADGKPVRVDVVDVDRGR